MGPSETDTVCMRARCVEIVENRKKSRLCERTSRTEIDDGREEKNAESRVHDDDSVHHKHNEKRETVRWQSDWGKK